MKVAILTTETTHHSYFVRRIAEAYSELRVFVEQIKPFISVPEPDLFHPLVENFERTLWFDGQSPKISSFAPTQSFESLNSNEAIGNIREFAPDTVIAFGTGILSNIMIDTCSPHFFNLHGGDPELYRGLDSHLWSIYHGDFTSLITTLHFVSSEVDTGKIVLQGQLPLSNCEALYQLRSVNTEVCIQLTLSLLCLLDRIGTILSRPQRSKGRYYSSMPGSLKQTCVRKFERYILGQTPRTSK